MSTTTIDISTAQPATLPTASWDLVSFIGNAANYGEVIGAAILGLLGIIALVAAGWFTFIKLTGNNQNQNSKSWFIIAALFLVGGAFITGGMGLFLNISSGGQQTIEELGGGMILLQSALGR